jgi:hypothetical protein
MQRTLTLLSLALAALLLSGCGFIKDIVTPPPPDYSGNYKASGLVFQNMCGEDRTSTLYLGVSSEVGDSESSHTFTMSLFVSDVISTPRTGSWTTSGATGSLSSPVMGDIVVTNVTRVPNGFTGSVEILNFACGEELGAQTRSASFAAARY